MTPNRVMDKLEDRLGVLNKRRFKKIADVPLEYAETPEHYRTPPEDLPYMPAPIGTAWGKPWESAWFRGEAVVPVEAAGQRLFYRHRSFAEKLLFVDARIYAALNPHHEEVLFADAAEAGLRYTLYIEAYAGHTVGQIDPSKDGEFWHQICGIDGREPPHYLEASEWVVERKEVAALYFDAHVLFETAKNLDEHSLRRAEIVRTLNAAYDLIPFSKDRDSEMDAAAPKARALLAPLLAKQNGPTTPQIGVAAYGHLDVGWLWPIPETVRKAARTFSTHLQLLEHYPELRCLQTQPLLLDYVRDHYPELLPRIRAAYDAGQWEPNGGMWIEADCMVSGGEALVRQFLEGYKATMADFGYQGDTLWIPDVFGYSGNLPQIARHCEIDHFVTSKLNWNDATRFPYDTFWWRGIDGTRLFTHFITGRIYGYNSFVSPEACWDAWRYVQHKEYQDGVVMTVGYGDGGGGVTRDQLEQGRRMNDLEGCPKTAFVSISEFLSRMREQDIDRPEWQGELYLEMHRGTYTSEARTKRFNRKMEFMLRDVELLSALAMRHGHPYPAAALQRLWRLLLTYQFHDTLAGTCIKRTHDEMETKYAASMRELETLRDEALRVLGRRMKTPAGEQAVVIAHTHASPAGQRLVVLEGHHAGRAYLADEGLPSQAFHRGSQPALAVLLPTNGIGLHVLTLRPGPPPVKETPFVDVAGRLETPFYRMRFDDVGRICSLVHKATERELVQPGKALNTLYSAEDLPIYWDAWDIEDYYRDVIEDETHLESRAVIERGPLFMTIRSVFRIGQRSMLTQDLTVYAHSPRIDFGTRVDWHERHRLLKAGFPLAIHSPDWRADIQFGHITRPRHRNQLPDRAQFESYAHKWVDVSEPDFGVALLNDCKYGHDCLDEMISITLLRAAMGSNTEGDQGEHHFTYALLPHEGPFTAEAVVHEGYALNAPPPWVDLGEERGTAAVPRPFCTVDNPNIVVEAVKKAEESDALVVRVYEAGGTRGHATLTFDRLIVHAASCTGLETKDQPLDPSGESLRLEFHPFEIKTLKLVLAET